MRRIMRGAVAALVVLVGVWLTAGGVLAAGNPGREPLSVGDLTGPFCGAALGDVLLHVDLNKEYVKTYTLQDGTTKFQVNGRFIADVSANGRLVTLNAGGPGALYIHPDGSVVATGFGRVLFIGIHGEGIWLYNGNALFDGATGLVISHTGHSTDVCALLSS